VAFLCGAPSRTAGRSSPTSRRRRRRSVLALEATAADGRPVVAGVNSEAAPGGARAALSPPSGGGAARPSAPCPARPGARGRRSPPLIQPVPRCATRAGPGGALRARRRQDRGDDPGGPRRRSSGAQASPSILLPTAAAGQTRWRRSLQGRAGQARLAAPKTGAPDPPGSGLPFHPRRASMWRCAGIRPRRRSARRPSSGHPHLEAADKPKHLGPVDAAAKRQGPSNGGISAGTRRGGRRLLALGGGWTISPAAAL